MFQNNPALLVLISVTLVALSLAINARGTVRIIISSLITVLCLALTGYQATMAVVEASTKAMEAQNAQTNQVVQEKLEKIEDLEATLKEQEVEDQTKKAEEEQASAAQLEEIATYKSQATNLLMEARDLNQKMAAHKIVPDNDEEYEVLVQKASYFLTESQKIKRSFLQLKAPAGTENPHETLRSALDMLVLAAGQLRRFYNAENSTEEMSATDFFRQKSKQAVSLLERAEKGLAGLSQ